MSNEVIKEHDGVVDFTCQVVILSAFPCIGKTSAAKLYENDGLINVTDLDSAAFKAALHPNHRDNWVKEYVDLIEAKTDFATTAQRMINTENTTHIFMVSCHDEVRKELSDRGIPYYYVIPSMDYFQEILETAKARAESTGASDGDKRAYDAMRQYGISWIEAANSAHEVTEFPTESVIELNTGCNLADLIDTAVHYVDSYRAKNLVASEVEYRLFKGVRKYFVNAFGAFDDGHSKILEAFIDHCGRPVLIGKQLNQKQLVNLLRKAGVPTRAFPQMAYRFTDMVMLSQSQANALYDLFNRMRSKLGDEIAVTELEDMALSSLNSRQMFNIESLITDLRLNPDLKEKYDAMIEKIDLDRITGGKD